MNHIKKVKGHKPANKVKNLQRNEAQKRRCSSNMPPEKKTRRDPLKNDEQISYQTPHTKLINLNEQHLPDHYPILYEDEPLTLAMQTYSRRVYSQPLSYLDMLKIIDELIEDYNTRIHTNQILLTKKRKRLNRKDLDSKQILNLRLKTALSIDPNHISDTKLAKLLNIKPSQLSYIRSKIRNGLTPQYEKTGRKSKIKQSYLDYLSAYLLRPQPIPTSLYLLKRKICEKFHLRLEDISSTLVAKMIRQIGFTKKRAQTRYFNRNSQQAIDQRFQLVEKMLKHVKLGRKFVYIDESSFDNQIVPIHGYSPRGTPYFVKVKPRMAQFSVLAAISEDGLMSFQIFDGSVRSWDFFSFILRLIKMHRMEELGLDNFVFFWDNCKIHSAKLFSLI